MSSTKTIAEQLTGLLNLQGIDGKIYGLLRQKNAKPFELQAARETRDRQKQAVSSEEKLLTELQLARKSREIDLETKEGNIKKLQTQLYQVKTNKEYLSFQKEIDLLKADQSLLEEEILKFMEEVDARKKSISEKKGILVGEEAKLAKEEARITQEITQIDQEISLLKEKRKVHIPEVEPPLFVRYEKILAGKEGLAVVPVNEISCLGCHMELPPQVINEVRLQEKVMTCENCARILYAPEAPAES